MLISELLKQRLLHHAREKSILSSQSSKSRSNTPSSSHYVSQAVVQRAWFHPHSSPVSDLSTYSISLATAQSADVAAQEQIRDR